VTILAHTTCKAWQEQRQQEAKTDIGEWISAALSTRWLLGYLSGLNAASTGKNALGAIDPDTVTAWTDRYCKQNPNSDLSEAGDQLFLELRKITE
jgi:hypothetical protein